LNTEYRGPGMVASMGVGRFHPYSLHLPHWMKSIPCMLRIREHTTVECSRILYVMEGESDCDLVEVEL
jgi:hypothetical protein